MTIKGGLKPPTFAQRNDPRNFTYRKLIKHHPKFGAGFLLPPDDIEDFTVKEPLEIKDQKPGTFSCTQASLASIVEETEGVPLDFWYTHAAVLKNIGAKKDQGVTPKDAWWGAKNVGYMEKKLVPFTEDTPPEKLANVDNYPPHFASAARIHRQKSLIEIEKTGGFFKNIWWTMWNRKRSIWAGVFWQPGWDSMTYITKNSYDPNFKASPHAIKILGIRKVKTETGRAEYLKFQNSYGKKIGENGIQYLPKELAEYLIFAKGIEDLDPEDVKKETWGILQKCYDFLVKFFVAKPMPEPPAPTMPTITQLAKAIERKENTKLYHADLNNPGALRLSHLQVGRKNIGTEARPNWFAYFKDYETGWKALIHQLTIVCNGKSIAYNEKVKEWDLHVINCSYMTLGQFCAAYAPSSDRNDPGKYAADLASWLNISINTQMRDFKVE